MDNVRVQQGDIYMIDNEKCRVFLMTSEYVGYIGLNRLFIKKDDSVKFVQNVRSGKIQRCDAMADTYSVNITNEELERIQSVARIMDNILQEQYPYWEVLAKPRCKKVFLQAGAAVLGYTSKHFSQKFFAYLRSGRNIYSLVDGRHFRNIKKETKVIQNPLQDNRPSQEVLSKQTLAYEDGLQEFKRILKVQGAHDYVITKYYSETKCEMNNGVLEEVIVPNEDAPSYSSFYRYVSSHLGGCTVTQYIKGERETRNNDRFLTGNQRSGMITIGQYMQVDECEVAVNLVSDDGTQIIGKPIMYCAFEPVAQIIIGAYIGLINNSMGGFNNLLLSMLEPHNNQTEPYGVTCTDENFPSMVIPKNFYSDQGSEYMSVHMEQAMLELGIAQSIVPAAAGSYKGGVENCFHRLQARLKTLLINDEYRIIITTIQKLTNFVSRNAGHKIANKKIVIIFDECHRSQFGEMHQKITKFFKHYYLFGFTGTPIFAENASKSANPKFATTPQLFGDKLHTYTIVDAINDENVLPFRIDYVNTIKRKDGADEKIEAIDTESALSNSKRISQIVGYVLDNYDRKTKQTASYMIKGKRVKGFNSIFACQSVEMAVAYYNEFKKQIADKKSNLTIATIYSFAANEARDIKTL